MHFCMTFKDTLRLQLSPAIHPVARLLVHQDLEAALRILVAEITSGVFFLFFQRFVVFLKEL